MSRYVEYSEEADRYGRKVAMPQFGRIFRDAGLVLILLIASMMYGCPQYNVWSEGLRGKAELTRAEQNRQIKIQEAEAQLQAASLLAKAEVERAKGVKEANDIIADGLGGAEGYLRYLYINGLTENAKGGQVIYIPTEASLPILEAKRK